MVTRNAPCPCGSGRRYKDCCGQLGQVPDQALAMPSPPTPAQLFQAGMAAVNGNRHQEAADIFEQLLAAEPAHLDAMNMLGTVRLLLGDLDRAEQLFRTVLSRVPTPIPGVVQNLELIDRNRRLRAEEATAARAVAEREGRAPGWPTDFTDETSCRIIAFYLPQYHRIPENDQWWGEGFTEWVNVRRGQPNFAGHYQPHEPGQLGYYDLSEPTVLARQAALAREHGIGGFCFYHYWFNGKRLLEMPVDRLLASGQPDFPYCLCWANENWSRNWDGGNRELLVAQQHSAADDEAFIRSLLPHFRDPRYIRVRGRPLLLVYRVPLLPEPAATIGRWRQVCRAEGLPDPYVVAALTFNRGSLADLQAAGIDAAVEFPPHGQMVSLGLGSSLREVRPGYRGRLISYTEMMGSWLHREPSSFPVFPGVLPSWDNTARRQDDGLTILGSSPAAFEVWLREMIHRSAARPEPDDRLIFVNAWNEWAEGCHLEPDRKYGLAWLQAVRNARRIPRDYQGIPGPAR